MNPLITFMASAAGRGIRIVAGGGIIAWGLLGSHADANTGLIIATLGALPVCTGLLNICVIGPLLGGPVSGNKALNQ